MVATRTLKTSVAEFLQRLDEFVNRIRREHRFSRPGETLTYYEDETSAGRYYYEVISDGYGSCTLYHFEGRNPNDRTALKEAEYDDDDAACAAARRLGANSVAWEDRDKPIPGDVWEAEEATEVELECLDCGVRGLPCKFDFYEDTYTCTSCRGTNVVDNINRDDEEDDE